MSIWYLFLLPTALDKCKYKYCQKPKLNKINYIEIHLPPPPNDTPTTILFVIIIKAINEGFGWLATKFKAKPV